MNLDAALDAAYSGRVRKGPTCTMGAVLTQVPDTTRTKLLQVLTTPNSSGLFVSTSVISELLAAAGYQVKPDAVMRHRRTLLGRQNGCACHA